MKIVCVNDEGQKEIIKCRKIEPATLAPGKLVIDECETIDIRNVIMIVEG